ncbi:MAG TPA: hypothetical protein VME22_07670 [Solirubrobacteraceae bacterium]|nr:hypothetical protein [Solirubrobacteraceae bacterium]
MDPIHPIAPLAPNITEIRPTPMARPVDRDSSRGGRGSDQRGRRRPQPDGNPSDPSSDQFDYAEDYADPEDDSGLHIDVTA